LCFAYKSTFLLDYLYIKKEENFFPAPAPLTTGILLPEHFYNNTQAAQDNQCAHTNKHGFQGQFAYQPRGNRAGYQTAYDQPCHYLYRCFVHDHDKSGGAGDRRKKFAQRGRTDGVLRAAAS
jgi:hypothetical protein